MAFKLGSLRITLTKVACRHNSIPFSNSLFAVRIKITGIVNEIITALFSALHYHLSLFTLYFSVIFLYHSLSATINSDLTLVIPLCFSNSYKIQIPVKHTNFIIQLHLRQHVSTLLSHHQAFWKTDPIYHHL